MTFVTMNINRFYKQFFKLAMTLLRMDSMAALIAPTRKLRVQWLREALCFVLNLVLADSFSFRNRQLLLAAKNMHSAKRPTVNINEQKNK